jgi:hypothetical protein
LLVVGNIMNATIYRKNRCTGDRILLELREIRSFMFSSWHVRMLWPLVDSCRHRGHFVRAVVGEKGDFVRMVRGRTRQMRPCGG